MGRVKSQEIKRTTKKLLEKYQELFAKDFEKNKAIIAKILPDINKRTRNRIAGYITRLKKKTIKEKSE